MSQIVIVVEPSDAGCWAGRLYVPGAAFCYLLGPFTTTQATSVLFRTLFRTPGLERLAQRMIAPSSA